MPFSFNAEGSTQAQLNKLFQQVEKESDDSLQRVIDETAAGAQAFIARAYQVQIYSARQSVFGYPRNDSQGLAQAVQMETGHHRASVFSTQLHAGYNEFGTGVFATIGAAGPITPKRGKYMAFPAWQLPADFKGAFIPREKAKGSLPVGAIGFVLARSLQGIAPRPVWFDPATEKAINRIAEQAVEREVSR